MEEAEIRAQMNVLIHPNHRHPMDHKWSMRVRFYNKEKGESSGSTNDSDQGPLTDAVEPDYESNSGESEEEMPPTVNEINEILEMLKE